jgi:hypothetical protein
MSVKLYARGVAVSLALVAISNSVFLQKIDSAVIDLSENARADSVRRARVGRQGRNFAYTRRLILR